MLGYLKRLVTTGAAYQFGDILAKGLALLTLPLYTRHLAPSAYGAAETLLTAVILSSILLRVGVGEAFIRFYFDDDDQERRARIARTATATVAWTTTLARARRGRLRRAISRSCCSASTTRMLIDCAMLGLWAFTNLEMAYAQLRVDERTRTYVIASGANVGMTVAVHGLAGRVRGPGRPRPAAGQLRRLGDRRARALVGAARPRLAAGPPRRPRRRCSASGCPRSRPTRASTRCRSPTASTCSATTRRRPPGCTRSRSSSQRSCSSPCAASSTPGRRWPTRSRATRRPVGCTRWSPPTTPSPRASSSAASRCWAAGWCACWPTPLLRRLQRAALAGPRLGALRPLPRVRRDLRARAGHLAQPSRRGGRPGRQHRLLAAARPRLGGAGSASPGAGIALCGAYAAMLSVMYLLTRSLFEVGFEWRRLAQLPGDPRRRRRHRRAAAPEPRRRSASCAGGLAGPRAPRAAAHPLLPSPRALRGQAPVGGRPPPGGRLPRGPRRCRGLRRGSAARRLSRPAAGAADRAGPLSRAGCTPRPPRAALAPPRRSRLAVTWRQKRRGVRPGRSSAASAAHGVAEGGQPAHGQRGRRRVVLAHVEVAVAGQFDDPPLGDGGGGELLVVDRRGRRHVQAAPARLRAGARRSRPRRSRRRSPGPGSRPAAAASRRTSSAADWHQSTSRMLLAAALDGQQPVQEERAGERGRGTGEAPGATPAGLPSGRSRRAPAQAAPGRSRRAAQSASVAPGLKLGVLVEQQAEAPPRPPQQLGVVGALAAPLAEGDRLVDRRVRRGPPRRSRRASRCRAPAPRSRTAAPTRSRPIASRPRSSSSRCEVFTTQ